MIARRAPALVAVGCTLVGFLATVVALDAPTDGTVVELVRSSFTRDGLVVTVPGGSGPLRSGDLITAVAGRPVADIGAVPRPEPGSTIGYDVVRDGRTLSVAVSVLRPDVLALIRAGWGNLIFVLALAGLAVAVRLRRPDEPATGPLLVFAAGLLGSTLTVAAGLPALAVASAAPQVWIFHLSTLGVFSLAWGALLAFALTISPRHPWRRALTAAYVAPLAIMLGWLGVAGLLAGNTLDWLGLVHAGQSAVVLAACLAGIVAGIVGYRADPDPVARRRLRWVASGGAVAALLGAAGWRLPEIVLGHHLMPIGSVGLSGLPFVAGIAIALRRHRLFDIERLANRSLAYAGTVSLLVTGYAAVVVLLTGGLRLSGVVAAALAAVGAAVALAPLLAAAQGVVNRIMYGRREDPAGVLARLGARLHDVLPPAQVLPAVVDTVARSLRLPYVAVDVAGQAQDGFHVSAEHGSAVGPVHVEPLLHHGEVVGRLRVSGRDRDDPLDPVDVRMIQALAAHIGPAAQAVRLHDDLVRSRAELVASREDERRRIRRDLHDGLAPALAAIGLKADLAVRDVPVDSAVAGLLRGISAEVVAGVADIRRLVDQLRPPALDELGLVGALRLRAAALAGPLSITVTGPADTALPAVAALPAAIETAAYRIATEAMTNAVRHSGGSVCAVQITVTEAGVDLVIIDDGCGLLPNHPAGVGVRSMMERAAEVGGTCTLRSGQAGGVRVEAWLPGRSA